MLAAIDARVESKKMWWIGWIMSALPAPLLLMSSTMKMLASPAATEGFVHLGYPEHVAFGIGIVELLCLVLYLVPQTSVLGAILLTGYLGGAVASHVRIGEPFYAAILLVIFIWGGLYLRDARVRVLFPLRSEQMK
ncbi:MAG: DoxX family protein [Nitrospira sp.]